MNLIDELKKASKIIKRPVPAGLIVHVEIARDIRRDCADLSPDINRVLHGGLPIYDYDDVPKLKPVLFWSHKQLDTYLKSRKDGKDHYRALLECLDLDINEHLWQNHDCD